jgi:uncharacterized protein YcgL (UPF0745 family)
MLRQQLQQIQDDRQIQKRAEIQEIINKIAKQIAHKGAGKPQYDIMVDALGRANLMSIGTIELLNEQLNSDGFKCYFITKDEEYFVDGVGKERGTQLYLRIIDLNINGITRFSAPILPSYNPILPIVPILPTPVLTMFKHRSSEQVSSVQLGYPLSFVQTPQTSGDSVLCSVTSDGFRLPLPNASHIPSMSFRQNY